MTAPAPARAPAPRPRPTSPAGASSSPAAAAASAPPAPSGSPRPGREVVVLDLDGDAAARAADGSAARRWSPTSPTPTPWRGCARPAARSPPPTSLVNNAGLQHVSPIEDFPPERFSLILRVMLDAPFPLVRAALPHMYAQGWGRVVNVSSVHGLRASPHKSAYVAAKHGLEGLSKVIALEGGGRGVTSNTICPGYVRTPLVEGQIAAQAQAHGIPESSVVEDVMLSAPSVKRLLEPSEVAELAAYLCSPAGLVRQRQRVRAGRRLVRPLSSPPVEVPVSSARSAVEVSHSDPRLHVWCPRRSLGPPYRPPPTPGGAPACSRSPTWRSPTAAPCRRCAASPWRCPTARSSRSWAATAPARPRCCARSRARCGCTAAGSSPARSASTTPTSAPATRRRPSRMGLVQVPEGRRIFGRLTVEENLRAGGMGSRDKAAKAKAQDAGLRAVPGARGAPDRSAAACCPAASSRCSPSAGR